MSIVPTTSTVRLFSKITKALPDYKITNDTIMTSGVFWADKMLEAELLMKGCRRYVLRTFKQFLMQNMLLGAKRNFSLLLHVEAV